MRPLALSIAPSWLLLQAALQDELPRDLLGRHFCKPGVIGDCLPQGFEDLVWTRLVLGRDVTATYQAPPFCRPLGILTCGPSPAGKSERWTEYQSGYCRTCPG